MIREASQSQLRQLEQEEAQLRSRLEELEDIVQSASGTHGSGVPSTETLKIERDIQTIVLAISDLDRKRQEITVEMSLNK